MLRSSLIPVIRRGNPTTTNNINSRNITVVDRCKLLQHMTANDTEKRDGSTLPNSTPGTVNQFYRSLPSNRSYHTRPSPVLLLGSNNIAPDRRFSPSSGSQVLEKHTAVYHQQRRTLFGFGNSKKNKGDNNNNDDTTESFSTTITPDSTNTNTNGIQDSSTVFQTENTTNVSNVSNVSNNAHTTSATTTSLSPEAEMAKFEQTAQVLEQTTATTTALTEWTATYWPDEQFILLLNEIQSLSGLSYAATIASTTAAIRFLLFPIFLSAQRNTARMAHMRPELDVLKAKIDAMDTTDTKLQTENAKQMQALFLKYQVNPLKAIFAPLVQAPVFMSMFFALRKMPDVFPERLVDGGALWFPDLTAADPYGALPVLSAVSFLCTIEAGKKQMLASSPDQGPLMLGFFRSLAVIMVPVTMSFSSAVFCYWTTNNAISCVQSVMFQNVTVRRALGIWDAPKPIPGAKPPKGVMDQLQEMMKKREEKAGKRDFVEKIRMHNAAIDLEKGKKVLEREGNREEIGGTTRGKKRGGGKRGKRR